MHRKSWNLALLNVLGGIAVLSSYLHGLATESARNGSIWGGIPADWQSFYTVSMIAAAIGYFPFTYFFLRCVDPERSRFAGDRGFDAVLICYALVLIPSALWLPLTLAMLRAPSAALWLAIRVDLALVAVGTLGLLIAAITIRPQPSALARSLAIVGLLAFALQTVVLDAVVWPAYYPF